ncbi:MAG: hypothetical protein H0S85_13075 [Desulfovibrionaceae bacterium]|jgi:hypothetical protein|nr:hypothetical protein [Desulfovibrionaceae bacterium]
MFLSPDEFIDLFFQREYPAFLSTLFSAVPERTLRNVLAGKTRPRAGTERLLVESACRFLGWDEDRLRNCMGSFQAKTWKTAFTAIKLGAEGRLPKSYDYFFDVIVRIEEAKQAAAEAKSRGNPFWFARLRESGLPQAILSEKFFGGCEADTRRSAGSGPTRDILTALLRSHLYCLAALEVSLLHSRDVAGSAQSSVVKAIPKYVNGKLVSPAKHFFDRVVELSGAKNVKEFAESLPGFLNKENYDIDPDSQRKNITRWVSGDLLPRWKTMFAIRETFFGSDDRILYDYFVIKYLQKFFTIYKNRYIPHHFANESELVDVFQEYASWFEANEVSYAEWESRGA